MWEHVTDQIGTVGAATYDKQMEHVDADTAEQLTDTHAHTRTHTPTLNPYVSVLPSACTPAEPHVK